MLVSVFTPSHDPTKLNSVYNSLKEQTYSEWEWVVVGNGPDVERVKAFVDNLSDNDSRVRFLKHESSSIGALKRFACEQAKGDLYLELDHDDLLTSDCLAEVIEAARKSPRNSFIYSDNLTLHENGTSWVYDKSHGWDHYSWEYKNNPYTINKTHDVNAKSLSEILWAPDHVRVWTKNAYLISGGHNKELIYGDDHELIIRTYLAGTQFVKIDKPLYIHQMSKESTCIKKQKEIQSLSHLHKNVYLHRLVNEWCRRENFPKYDLGGAHNCPDTYIPIDLCAKPPGIAVDILSPEFDAVIPDNSVGCFRASDFMEHVPVLKITGLMNVLYKKLVPGGWLLTNTPAVSDSDGRVGRGAYQDPTHVSYWSENNWWYFTKKEYAKYVPEIKCRFQAAVNFNYYPSDFHKQFSVPYVRCDMCAIKDEKPWSPGPKMI